MWHLRYLAANPRRVILYFSVRVAWTSSCGPGEDAAETKTSMLIAMSRIPHADVLWKRNGSA